jgi:[protein-PII] uridylyltransferase
VVDISLKDRRLALLGDTSLHGLELCSAYCAEADGWLTQLIEEASGGSPKHFALLAVGGYGRGELFPFSDLDVVLVYDGRHSISALADAIWYPVWDEGVHLDHSVRTPKETLAAADSDLRVALGLLDARLVWGDERVAKPLLDEVTDRWRKYLGARWLPTLSEQMRERHRLQGDVAFLLEPNLKESHGGLRDVNALQALRKYAPLLADYVDLPSLDPAVAVLADVRVELHRSSKRSLDTLLLQEQDHIATTLGYEDADSLMSSVSEAGRRVAWVSDDAWRRRRFWDPSRPRRNRWFRRRSHDGTYPNSQEIENVDDPDVAVVGGEVTLRPSAAVADDFTLALRVAAIAAERKLPISRATIHRLADKCPRPSTRWPASGKDALIRLLATGEPAIETFESLDEEGIVVRILPEWQAVRNKPQRNAYHRYTVDRHLLETVANAASLTSNVTRPDLLLVGALLHDIGKGFPGDHTEIGIDKVRLIGQRIGFEPDDVEILSNMVRYHLLLPDTATRRDLDDPATIERVATLVGNRELLSLLWMLTEADSKATGPAAWGSWKAGLVADLVGRTEEALAGTSPSGVNRLTRLLDDMRNHLSDRVRKTRRSAVVVRPPRVFVAAEDRRGLLSSVTGVLALHDLNVQSADTTSRDGIIVDVFTVDAQHSRWPDSFDLERDIDLTIQGGIEVEERLEKKARAYASSRRAEAAHPVAVAVSIDNDASSAATVVEVHATDEIGLLHHVTKALFNCDLDVVSARVSTIGTEVIDAFYVRDSTGAKVTDERRARMIESHLRSAIARSSARAAS